MNQKNVDRAAAYLRENKGRHSKEVLVEQMQKAGYSDQVIQAAVTQVFSGVAVPPTSQSSDTRATERSQGFFDLRNRKVYDSVGGKVIDFFAGVVAIFLGFFVYTFVNFFLGFLTIFGLRLYILSFIPSIVLLVFYVGGILYLWKRRKYIAIGMLSLLLLGIIVIGFLILLLISAFGGGSFF